MIALLQRVTQAKVEVDGRAVGEISQGLLAFIGVERGDSENTGARLLQRVLGYRVFEDDAGRMNRSVQNIAGGLLLVPQFTLAADTNTGMRPSFTSAAEPAIGEPLFDFILEHARAKHDTVAAGVFGADMQVTLTNDGPVTFWLQVKGDQN